MALTPGSKVFHRQLNQSPPMATSGAGVYLIDDKGKRYIDASGGAAVSCLGHGHPKVIAAIVEQAQTLAFAHTAFFTSQPAEQLAQHLIARAPQGIDQVYFLSGGSEAIESALKTARQYFVEKGESGRTKFIARKQSYHGNTLGALSVSSNVLRRQKFLPLLTDTIHIDPCYAYRNQLQSESKQDYALRAANALETAIVQAGPENIIGFVAETVGGATGGVLMPEVGYWARIRQICDQYGILLILDEVMCGMGRTGSLFACQQEQLRPDLIAIGKGLGGGYQPIGAMLCSSSIYQTLKQTSGALMGGHTYMGHPIACAAALAVQQAIVDEELLDNVMKMGTAFEAGLHETLADHPHVGDIRGRGLFWGIELVKDKASKQPFPAQLRLHSRIKCLAMEQGLICYPGGGTVDGLSGDHIMLAPPFIINAQQLEEIRHKLLITINLATSETQQTDAH
ncbi:MAG: adenosylmethionine-8-amino-7-oxononanoate aminotransferase [Pseudohongiellaceae bacterium]|jgi:adenosylmethionine-8-amino-7-oxononanoate aminotransferase